MMTFPPLALSRAGHGLLRLLPQAAGALLLCWCVATLVMLLSPPAPRWRELSAPSPQTAAGLVAQQSWFGRVPDVAALAAAPPLEVMGVLGNGKGGHGDFAIVRENGVKIVLQAGQRSPGGWQLLSVSGHGVVVSRDGREQRIDLSSDKAAASASPAPALAGELPLPPPQGDGERVD